MAGPTLLLVGLLFSGLGLPLARGAIKRNRLYGYRTPSSLSDDRVWYPANRAAGLALSIAGVALVMMAALVFADVLPDTPMLVLIALPLAVLPSVVYGSMAAQRAVAEVEQQR